MGKLVQPNLAVEYCPEKVSGIGESTPFGREAFKFEVEYINGLRKPVTCVTRDNLKILVPPDNLHGIYDFIVRVRFTVRHDTFLDMSSLRNYSTPHKKLLVELFSNGEANRSVTHNSYGLDFYFSESLFETRGGSLYASNLDTIFSVLDSKYVPSHPMSEPGIKDTLINGAHFSNSTDSFGYAIKIVDKHDQYGERFVNINQQVYKVPKSQAAELADGVYLVCSGPVTANVQFPKPVVTRYDFDQADTQLRLYTSVELAKTHGDEIGERERSLKEREHAFKQDRLKRQEEHEQFKTALDKQRLDEEAERKKEEARINEKLSRLKEELAEIEHQREKLKMERRDKYEERQQNRKESGDIVKFLPIVATGILALVMAFMKK